MTVPPVRCAAAARREEPGRREGEGEGNDEGPEPCPLAQGCQDHAVGLAIEESARTGADVRAAKEVWV